MFRLAWTLKKSVQEILVLPQWERECWRDLFAAYGPLDWKRDDLLFARVNQYQSVGNDPLKEFLLFADPSEAENNAKQTEDELMRKLGYVGD